MFRDKEGGTVRTGSLATAAATHGKRRLAELKSPVSWSPGSWHYAGIQDKGTERPFGSYDSTIKFDKDGKPIINKHLGNRLYTGKDEELMRSRHGDPPREDFNDGERYRGRGFVQLTGRYNYQQMQKRLEGRLKVDLVEHPETAADADTAAGILACLINCIARKSRRR